MVHPVQSVVESLYAAGRCPRLHINSRCTDVVCPEFIRDQWQDRLIIDLDTSYPLDLHFSDEGISADLSFGGYVTRCTFPWHTIYVVADRATGRGIVLDGNMPESVRRSSQSPTTGPLPKHGDLKPVLDGPGTSSSGSKRAGLSAVESTRSRADHGRPAETESTAPPRSSRSADSDSVIRRRAAFRVINGGA